jgi:hypothetical protein
MSKLSDYLRAKINAVSEDREISSVWGFYFSSGLAAGEDGRHWDARRDELVAVAMRWPDLAVVIRDRESPAPADKRAE